MEKEYLKHKLPRICLWKLEMKLMLSLNKQVAAVINDHFDNLLNIKSNLIVKEIFISKYIIRTCLII